MIEIFNMDCMDLLRSAKDKQWDLAIVDPPYGIDDLTKNKNGRHRNNITSYRNKATPGADYFSQLRRVAAASIIWGCQYYIHEMNPEGSFIVWDKMRDPETCNGSACDIAWYSERKRVERFRGTWNGAVKLDNEQTIHPHQKPVALYKWLLDKYSNPGDKILDTHLGSGSIAIACHDYGYDLTATELDKDYFDAASKRLKQHQAQTKLFA